MATLFERVFGTRVTPSTPTTEKKGVERNLNNYISKVQLERIRQDIFTWREAITEAESAWYPHRVRMQRIYQDTVLNGHVFSCMERRKDLTLLRDFVVCSEDGTVNDEWTNFFKTEWFSLWVNYGLDALAYGYQLVAMGDVENNSFPNLTIVKRQNISPDRLMVGALVYSLSGIEFREQPEKQWHTYFKTPTENAASLCGYGYLYKVAYYEIFLRNLTGANADYLQTFGQPFVVGKTPKTEEYERAEMLEIVLNMAASNAAVIDPEDTIEFIEAKGGGSGSDAYDNFEVRCEKKISKIILGHADAMDSTAGKLGAEQGEESPVSKALRDKKTKDGNYIESAVNGELFWQLREIGFNIPTGLKFRFTNDEEEEVLRQREDKSNQAAATIMKTISDAGGEPDWAYFSKRTGIEVEKKEVEPIVTPEIEESVNMSERVKNKLDKMYAVK